jgi:UDP-N-acetylmuramyl pentapeptide phosphotransferase/UDP-N-acetylglucosamine-1-phosphate transferase
MIHLVIFIILSVLSYAYYKIADRLNIVDKPNHRSSHTVTTIRGGGILFYLALVVFFITSGFEYPYLFVGVTLIALVSFIDDLKPLSPGVRMPIQFLSIALVLWQLDLGYPWYALILLLIAGVGFINFYNFMDGINGLTALYSLVVVGFLAFFNRYELFFIDGDLLIFLGMSIIIFMFYNFRKKALFFSGDVGSISIAVILFFLLVLLGTIADSPAVVLLIGVYGIDTSITILKRKFLLKEHITDAHRRHMYQIMVDTGKANHLQTSVFYAVIQLVLCVIFYYIYTMSWVSQIMVSFVVLSALTVLYILLNLKWKPTDSSLRNAS